ncbi:hypothetical protein E4U41_002376, partial [Claviceps citrina]
PCGRTRCSTGTRPASPAPSAWTTRLTSRSLTPSRARTSLATLIPASTWMPSRTRSRRTWILGCLLTGVSGGSLRI